MDTAPVDAPRAVMLAISEIAARDGVSKQAVSRKVRQLVEKHDLQVERDELGRVIKVNVAHYDHLRGRLDDPSKAQAPPRVPKSESYDEALRLKTWTEAERSRLRLQEEMGQLLPVADVAEAVKACGEETVLVVKRLVNFADELAAVVARDGTHGLRLMLKTIADRQCGEIADAVGQLGKLAAKNMPSAPVCEFPISSGRVRENVGSTAAKEEEAPG